MVADTGYPYDSYTKDSVYPESCITSTNPSHHGINYCRDNYSIYASWDNDRDVSNAGYLFCMVSRYDLMLYDACDIVKENVYQEIRSVAMILIGGLR